MKDGIIKGEGNSRILRAPATIPTSFAEFRNALINGTLSVDLLYNAVGWDVEGTALNKANLLSDEVAERYDLEGEGATVNEALGNAATQKSVDEAITDMQLEMNDRVPEGGVAGQILKNNGDETSRWEEAKAEETEISETVRTLYGLAIGDANVSKALVRACNGANNALVKFNLCYPNTSEVVTGTYTFTISSPNLYKSISVTTDGVKENITMMLPIGTYTITPPSNILTPFLNQPYTFTISLGEYYKAQSLFAYGVRTITSSSSIQVDLTAMSKLSSVDICLIGGGAAGGGHAGIYNASACGGGGGGYVKNINISAALFTQSTITATIGAGGIGSNTSPFGTNGGTTSLTISTVNTYTSNGGNCPGTASNGGSGGSGGGASTGGGSSAGGSGGTNGGDGSNASTYVGGTGQGTSTAIFSSGTPYGAGGGGGSGNSTAAVGGNYGGGAGGIYGGNGSNASAYGGGGGGGGTALGASSNSWPVAGGNGYAGVIALRFNA